MFKKELLKTKAVILGGARFTLRKLNPALFLDKDYMFPISNVTEAILKKEKGRESEIDQKEIDGYKDKVRDIILKGVVKVRRWLKVKKIEELIDDIMTKPELYNALFVEIVGYTLGIKKKMSRSFSSVESLRPMFIS